MRIALAQVNPTVGALEANAALVIEWMRAAEGAGADVVAFPELVISGYPPEDLLLKDHFLTRCWSALLQVAAANSGICALVGVPVSDGTAIYNSAAIVAGGRVAGRLQEDLSAQLRGVRREAVLHARRSHHGLGSGRHPHWSQHL